MSKSFRKILVSIDFNERSALAVRKAIQLIDPQEGNIGLHYICKPLFSLNLFFDTGHIAAPASEILTTSEIDQQFAKYVNMIMQKIPRVKIDTIISKSGRIQQKIEKAAASFNPDLIIVCDQTDRKYLFTNGQVSLKEIAKNTKCPIMNIEALTEV